MGLHGRDEMLDKLLEANARSAGPTITLGAAVADVFGQAREGFNFLAHIVIDGKVQRTFDSLAKRLGNELDAASQLKHGDGETVAKVIMLSLFACIMTFIIRRVLLPLFSCRFWCLSSCCGAGKRKRKRTKKRSKRKKKRKELVAEETESSDYDAETGKCVKGPGMRPLGSHRGAKTKRGGRRVRQKAAKRQNALEREARDRAREEAKLEAEGWEKVTKRHAKRNDADLAGKKPSATAFDVPSTGAEGLRRRTTVSTTSDDRGWSGAYDILRDSALDLPPADNQE